jgi:hypothetical protein
MDCLLSIKMVVVMVMIEVMSEALHLRSLTEKARRYGSGDVLNAVRPEHYLLQLRSNAYQNKRHPYDHHSSLFIVYSYPLYQYFFYTSIALALLGLPEMPS